MTLQELFRKPRSWTQGAMARPLPGATVAKCGPEDEEAACWCLLGGLAKCYGYNDYGPRGRAWRAAERKLKAAIRQQTGWKRVCIYKYNDEDARTIGEIREIVKKAGV